MTLIRIKQLEERTATAGLHMGDAEPPKYRRKLEPGEIMDLPDDVALPDGRNLLDALWNTGTIDVLPDSAVATRPLDYADETEARLCAPSFKPLDPSQERDMKEARARVEARLHEPSPPPEAESPDDDTPDDEVETPELPPAASLEGSQRRQRRRGANRAAASGAEIST